MRLLLITAACCVSIMATAQQQAHFKNLTEKDGLSNNRVTCFLKDQAGYLWIGTESGLNRYNGNSWKIYKPSPGKKNFLSNSFITDIEQDQHGSIWVSTRKGLNRIDPVAGTTDVFFPGDDHAIPNDFIWDTYPDTDTSIWIASDAKEFSHYNPLTKKFYYYDFIKFLDKHQYGINPGYHSIFRILPKSATELWLATTDGIFTFNKQTGGFAPAAALAIHGITLLYFNDQNQKLYCADRENKLYIIDPVSKQTTSFSLDKDQYANKINLFHPLKEPALFIPTGEGILCMTEDNDVSFFLEGSPGKANALLPGKINCIYKDRQEITWVGTDNGVSKFIPALNKNLNIYLPYNLVLNPDISLKNFTHLPLRDEWLIASWRNNTIYRASNLTGAVTVLVKPADFRYDSCFAFYAKNKDSLYILGKGCLFLCTKGLDLWEKIPLPAPFDQTIIICMAIDPEGNFWLGNLSRELFIFSPITRKIWVPDRKDIDRNLTTCLATDLQNNCMWIGTSGYGLIKYDFTKKTFRFIEPDIKSETAIHSFLINDILPDGNGQIWLATFEGGLTKYNPLLPDNEAAHNYGIMTGLPDDNIYGLASDNQGGVWFTTINGIGHMTADGSWKGLYNQESGLPFSKFQQSIATLPGGKVATITENNFICFDPGTGISSLDYPVVIDQILVNDTMTINNSASGETRKFSYRQNAFIFQYAVLDFISPGAAGYDYMLEGYEKEWVNAGAQHSVRYSKLSPGTYTFKVRAKNENGGFYTQVAEFRFHISPPFWKTWWFRSTTALFITIIAIWLLRRRIRNIRREAGLKHRMAEAEMAALRSQMNPHFIFNCINAIDNLIQTNQKEKATAYLSRFAKLIRNVLDSSKNNLVPFQKDSESLQLYLQMEQFRCSNRFDYSVTASPALLQGDYKVPPLILQPFVENAIHHGLLNKESNDRYLSVHAELKEHFIQYSVTDNGIGRLKAETLKQINKPGHQSYGIQITEERVRLHNKEDESAGDVIFTDLYEQGQPAGTRVDIRLKITDNT